MGRKGVVNLSATLITWCRDICKTVERNRRQLKVNNGIYDYPSVAVVASDSGLSYSGRGRSCKPQHQEYRDTPALEKKLKSLGTIGGKKKKGCDNIIGACAEAHSAHKVMRHFGNRFTLKSIVFSQAVRPRTMEVVEYCENCKSTFPTL